MESYYFKFLVQLCCCIMIILVTFGFYLPPFKVDPTPISISNVEDRHTLFTPDDSDRRYFAVFDCSTPSNKSHRNFDYAFYLPLSVMAWQRIGFESIILIIGERQEWEIHPILSLTLEALDELSEVAKVIFIPAKAENRVMLGQTARIFVANMKEFPGRSTDFILTSDADLWPLRKEHFYPPPGTDRSLILMHSDLCCDPFKFNGRSYKMFPMSHIGASASIWQEIVNTNPSKMAKDSTTIMAYFQQVFGDRDYQSMKFESDEWFVDQKLVSIRIDEWINKQSSKKAVYKVPDDGFFRFNRIAWEYHLNRLRTSSISSYFDAHLIVNGFLPKKWASVKPLVSTMYGKTSQQFYWIDQYATDFYTRFVKWNSSQIK